MHNFVELNRCLCCPNEKLEKILNLEEQPLANSYLKSKEEYEEYFPLALNFCHNCSHLQLTHSVDPDLLFKNYLYVSGTTESLKKYFHDFVSLTEEFLVKNNKKVLDIACNDGSQLDAFKKAGYETYGIDPAENLHHFSSKNHKVICDYLNDDAMKQLGNDRYDIIIAQNVFAHNGYPKKFLEIVKNYMDNDSVLFIQTSQANMVEYGQFDTVYHEHISFFNSKSMKVLLDSCDLYLHEVLKPSIHGTSYVFVISKDKNRDRGEFLVDYEKKNSPVQSYDSVLCLQKNANNAIKNLKKDIEYYRNEGYEIVGYGAAAKGNTLLNYGSVKLDFIVDDNTLKQNLFTPGQRIEIVSLKYVCDRFVDKKIAWIPLSWNFFDEIKTRIQKTRKSEADTFIKISFAS